MIGLYLGLGALLLLAAGKKASSQKIAMNNKTWTQFDVLFKRYGIKYDVDWRMLKAIALNESDLGRVASVLHGLQNPIDIDQSKSSDGKSWGLMQVTLTTAKDLDPLATAQKLNNAEYSIELAAKYIGNYLKPRFSMTDGRRLEWIIKSYNQGPGNTAKEKMGYISGYAQEYWERYQRNYKRALDYE